jgi:hypothetical protein
MTGIAFGASPGWHKGRLWFSDWIAEKILDDDLDGNSDVTLFMMATEWRGTKYMADRWHWPGTSSSNCPG